MAEALLATAMGLIAAIPAGIAYNRFVAKIDGIAAKYQLFTEELTNIMYRRVHAQS